MKIYDMHIHSFNGKIDPDGLLGKMEACGVYGGCVFSNWPKESSVLGTDFSARLAEALAWSKGREDRIFPVLWIHPFEEDIEEKVKVAAKAGIAAFKMICTDYYVYDERCMSVLKEIAKLGKPVMFHSGILWGDGEPSSRYNRPLNWEALLEIDGLKFSMGHCAWPWIDECIALYGKFLNALRNGKTSEMFFDITPGTPKIYREELLTKLYTVGYDVGNNLLFGTDGSAEEYRAEWTAGWLKTDGAILDALGVSKLNRKKLYSENLLRFLGKTEDIRAKASPEIDNAHLWSAVEPTVRLIVEKWYKTLGFPKTYDKEFENALQTVNVSDAITLSAYDKDHEDGKRNLLSFLYLCEQASQQYRALNIPEEILLDTLRDIVTWTVEWSNVKGSLYLGELSWLSRHLGVKLFKLGRLQFCMAGAEHAIPQYGLKQGDNVIEIHIPRGGRLDAQEITASIQRAKAFFAEYFPDYKYEYFTCHSWLLDEKLREYLPENSNILRFGDLFDRVAADESNALIRYLFRWDTTEQNLPYAVCNSGFAQKIKTAVLGGEMFHETLGVIKKEG